MDIGKRLRQLREAKGLVQTDIGNRSGLARPYISRVECGHTMPTLETLERWSKALDVPMHQLFVQDRTGSVFRGHKTRVRLTFYENRLFELLRRLNEMDRRLILSTANTMAKHRGRHGGP